MHPSDIDPHALAQTDQQVEEVDLEHAGVVKRQRRELYQWIESFLLKSAVWIIVVGAVCLALTLGVEFLTPSGTEGWLHETQVTAIQTAAIGIKEAVSGAAFLFLGYRGYRRYSGNRDPQQQADPTS